MASEADSRTMMQSFVGRHDEIAILLDALGAAIRGEGRTLLLAGPAGMGKTRLAEEFSGRARDRGVRVVAGPCWEEPGAPAYWPWVQALRAIVRDLDADALRTVAGEGAADLAQILPEIKRALPDLPEPPSLDAEAARFRLFDSTAAFLRGVALQEPLLLVLEDLHAADTPSLLLLRFIARTVADAPIVVLGTYREDEVRAPHPLAPTLAQLARERSTVLVTLQGLTEAEVASFITMTTSKQPSGSVVTALHQRTEGNPLFVREIARLLAAEDALTGDLAATDVRITQGVRDVIGRRLRHISETCSHVLSLASVLGREFQLEALSELSERSTEDLLEVLDEAVRAGLVLEPFGSITSMRFSHALVRDTLYSELAAARRVRLHGRAAAILERHHRDDLDRLGELAYHFSVGAPAAGAEKAVDYARRAGEHALNVLAYEEAARLFQMAIDSLQMSGSDDEPTRGDLLIALGEAHARAGDDAEAKRSFKAAADIAKRAGLADLQARAALGYGGRFVWQRGEADAAIIPLLEDALAALGEQDSPIRARVMARLGGALRSEGREPRETLARRGVEIARRIGDRGTLVYALAGCFSALWRPDCAEERSQIVEEMISLSQASNDKDDLLNAYVWDLCTGLELGDIPRVRSRLVDLTRLAAGLRQPGLTWLDLAMRATFALFTGDIDGSERLAGEALDRGARALRWNATLANRMHVFLIERERGDISGLEPLLRTSAAEFATFPMLACAHAQVLLAQGRDADAAATARAFVADDFAKVPEDNGWTMTMSLLAESISALNDAASAQRILEKLLPYRHLNAVGPGEGTLGSVARYAGLAAWTAGRIDQAAELFEEALAHNRSMGARVWELHTQFDFARMLVERDLAGDRYRAERMLRQAISDCASLGMTVLSRAASHHLAGLGAEPSAPPPGSTDAAGVSMFRREGEYWTVAFAGDAFRLKDSKGLRYIASLLEEPGREFHVLDLVALERGSVSGQAGAAGPDHGDAGEVLDAEAKEAYRARLRDLEEELAESRSFGDDERAARAQEEIAFIAKELAAAVGLGGRDRRAASAAERARVNVTRAIRSALPRIREHSPALARHFEATLRTGTFCVYDPDPRTPFRWST